MVSLLKPRQAEVTGKSKGMFGDLVPLVGCDLNTTGGGEATPEAHLPPEAFFL